ncbi:hypothetical protein HJFPF1_06747 [Paramyrothecium foliicola]|nr:hypothetical protein HJFPF1_06747 [Paramyrothecium foliicola]
MKQGLNECVRALSGAFHSTARHAAGSSSHAATRKPEHMDLSPGFSDSSGRKWAVQGELKRRVAAVAHLSLTQGNAKGLQLYDV